MADSPQSTGKSERRRPHTATFKGIPRVLLLATAACVAMAAVPALQLLTRSIGCGVLGDNTFLLSPSAGLRFHYSIDATTGFIYSIHSRTGPVILDSRLAFGDDLNPGASSEWWSSLRVASVSRSSSRSEWKQPFGERSVVPDRYNELRIGLTPAANGGDANTAASGPPEVTLQIRAYDEAVAFRITLEQALPEALRQDIGTEAVEFNVPPGTYAYWNTYAQGTYERHPLSSNLTKPCEPPLTLELADGQWASILEAGQVDFAHMTVALAAKDRMVSLLDGKVHIERFPYSLPWRVVMVADTPGQLLEHNYISLNLNPPNQLADTSWIKPGRVIRTMRLDTEFALKTIDFAADFNIDYVELDAGWYGSEYDPRNDATKWNATLIDLPAVIAYAKFKARKVMLYVNHIELERHLEEILDTYQKWGVDAVKYGFVNVGPQNWTQWLHRAVAEAAKRKLVVDVHDNYRPTGFQRTYPNLLQVEGIRGDEAFPTAEQSTMYPFTRFVAGFADHTYSFHHNKMQKTKAHQLALSVVNFGPLQFLFWYDWYGSYAGDKIAEIELWRDLPTVWDDMRVLVGVPGQIVTVARMRGNDWWLGTVTNETAQTCTVGFDFLEEGSSYEAVIYEDGADNAVLNRTLALNRMSRVELNLRPSGGAAMRIRTRGRPLF